MQVVLYSGHKTAVAVVEYFLNAVLVVVCLHRKSA